MLSTQRPSGSNSLGVDPISPLAVGVASTTAAVGLRAQYEAQGYAVVPGLIPKQHIDRVLEAYDRQIIPAQAKFYRQNTGRYERNRFSAHGYVAQSFLDIHAYRSFPDFRSAALEVFFH